MTSIPCPGWASGRGLQPVPKRDGVFIVYVQKAHPIDGWQSDSNATEGVLFQQHQDYCEREAVANTCSLDLRIGIPVLIEEMDNAIDEAYGTAPERLYIVGVDGKMTCHGGAGPHFFDVDEWEHAIETCLKNQASLSKLQISNGRGVRAAWIKR